MRMAVKLHGDVYKRQCQAHPSIERITIMNKGLLQIAEGFAMVADGYRKMASEGMEILKDAQTEEKPEKSSTSEKKISITEVRAVMAENPVQEKRRKSNSY